MQEESDWRLTGQQRYLQGVSLQRKQYVPPRPGWDHDHCQFCWAKFMDKDDPDVLRAGYTDGYHWICERCFDDFKESFDWKVV